MNVIFRIIYNHLILPFQESVAPISHISRGAAIGVFVGLTPTMGVQMYIVAMIWIFCRYLLKFRFNLPISVALVWISNPVTVLPLYYLFLITGNFLLELIGWAGSFLDYDGLREIIAGSGNDQSMGWWERILKGFIFIFWTLGWPMIAGSLAWAIPLTALTYPFTTIGMLKYRNFIAQREGMTYQEWKNQNVRIDS